MSGCHRKTPDNYRHINLAEKLKTLLKLSIMKRLFAMALLVGLFSCGNNEGQGADASADTARTDIGRVENVNGNIPDTTATGATPRSGTNTPPVDSSYADTANKK